MNYRLYWLNPNDISGSDKELYVIGAGLDLVKSPAFTRTRNTNDSLCYHLLYFKEGGCDFDTGEISGTAKAGDLIFFHTKSKYSYTYSHDPVTSVYWLSFSGSKATEIVSDMGFCDSFLTDSVSHISKYFEGIIDEIMFKKMYSNKAVVGYIYLLLTAISRKNETPDQKLDKIILLMNDIKNKGMSLDDYAALCHLSKSQFIRNFKNYTGKTPVKYRNDILTENAKWYLGSTSLTITEISELLGFENIYYFSTVFKKSTGMSPIEYRKQS